MSADNSVGLGGMTAGLTPEEMEHMRWRGSEWERSPFTEMVQAGGPDAILPGIRGRLGILEHQVAVEHREDPSNPLYATRLLQQEVAERAWAIRYIYPLGLRPWPKGLKDMKLDTDEKLRRELVAACQLAADESLARVELLEKFIEQNKWGGNVEDYLFKYFVTLGKKNLPAKDYQRILRAPETMRGFVEFGRKTEKAFAELLRIGRGEATVSMNGEIYKVPNIFGMAPNQGVLDFALRRVVAPSLKSLRDPSVGVPQGVDEKVFRDFEEADDYQAVVLAYMLFRHWDFDVYFAFGRKGGGESFASKVLDARDLADADLQIDYGNKDSAKVMFAEIRRMMEWRGTVDPTKISQGERRDFPRTAGNPMTLGVVPSFAANALDVMTTQLSITPEIKAQIDKQVTGSLESKTITLSVYDACYQDEARNVQVKVNGQTQYVTLKYKPMSIADINWDNALVLFPEPGKYLDFVMGPQTNAFEVPYKLWAFYYFQGLWTEFTRTDYWNQFKEYSETDKLRKMNKAFTNAITFAVTGFHLRKETAEKLDTYLRDHLIGSTMAAVQDLSSGDHRDIESGGLTNRVAGQYKIKRDTGTLLEEARRASFVPVDKKGEVVAEHKRFIERVRDARQPILPGDSGMFTDEQLVELLPIYPLGVSEDKSTQARIERLARSRS